MRSFDPRRQPWIAHHVPNPSARLRLFCFPFAGGGASAYRGWARELPAAVEVCPVQYPGRETRIAEPLQTALPVLLRMAAGALEPLLDEPYVLFGHSMGALVAFELTREIARRGLRPPEQLVVSAYRAPTLPHWSALPYDLPHDEFVERLRRLEGTPQAALESPELMEMILPVLRADCQVCDQYRLRDETPLAVPLAAFGGRHDPEAGEAQLQPWQALAGAGFALRMFDGGHFYIQSARAEVLAALSGVLQPHCR